MEMLTYLLEVNIYICICYGFYRLALRQQTFFTLNRMYLLSSVLFSFLLPFFQAGKLADLIYPAQPDYVMVQQQAVVANATVRWHEGSTGQLLIYGYMLVTVLLAAKLAVSLFRVFRLTRLHPARTLRGVKVVELADTRHPGFSFFKTLFISARAESRDTIIRHELVHIKRLHSYDVMFFEIVRIVCWFNPCVHLLRNDLKLLHEFEADELTVPETDRYDYAMFLIRNSCGLPDYQLTNHIFNQSILKRRINMLNKQHTRKSGRLRYLLAAPVGVALLGISTMAFTDAGYKKVDLAPSAPILIKVSGQDTVRKIRIDRTNQADGKNFFMTHRKGKYGKSYPAEKRYVILNGKPLQTDKVGAVLDARSVKTLDATSAVQRFGEKAKYGAVIIEGENARVMGYPAPPPPPPVEPAPPAVKTVRFPPPHVRTKPAAKKARVPFPPPTVEKVRFPAPPPPPEPPATEPAVTNIRLTGKTEPATATTITIAPEAVAAKTVEMSRISYSITASEPAAKNEPRQNEITVRGYPLNGGNRAERKTAPASKVQLKPITVTGRPLKKLN